MVDLYMFHAYTHESGFIRHTRKVIKVGQTTWLDSAWSSNLKNRKVWTWSFYRCSPRKSRDMRNPIAVKAATPSPARHQSSLSLAISVNCRKCLKKKRRKKTGCKRQKWSTMLNTPWQWMSLQQVNEFCSTISSQAQT